MLVQDENAAPVRKEIKCNRIKVLMGMHSYYLYDETLKGWEDEHDWTVKDSVWAKVTFDNLFTTTVQDTETETVTESATE